MADNKHFVMRKIENTEEKPENRTLRLTNSAWVALLKLKPRNKSWSLFIEELSDKINYFKSL